MAVKMSKDNKKIYRWMREPKVEQDEKFWWKEIKQKGRGSEKMDIK